MFQVFVLHSKISMAKEILEQLFDSPVKVKLFKLFLRNEEDSFTFSEITRKIKSAPRACRRELNKLEDIRFINSRLKSKKRIYSVNRNFDFYPELRTLVLKSSPTSKKKMLRRIKVLGGIKLALISGIFTNTENARADLLIVGDNISKKRLSNFLLDLEADVGKEIDFVVLGIDEFNYRFEMFDRFLLDILEKPHEKLVNKLKLLD